MTQTRKTSRRAFFASGGAMLGAGVAATAGAAALTPAAPDGELARLKAELAQAAARDAIRAVHGRFLAAMQSQRYEAIPALFDAGATPELGGVTACRPDALHEAETVSVAADGSRATARFPVEVEISTPLVGDSTVIAMSRLQGHVADRRWERGRLEVEYTARAGQWMITSLRYASA